jgi:hypothetical protein
VRIRELACLCALLCCACKQIDVVAVRDDVQKPRPDAQVPGAGEPDAQTKDAKVPDNVADASPRDAQVPDARVPEMPCPYEMLVPSGSASQLDAAGARKLSHAICSCAGISSSEPLITDAFDGALGAYTRGEPGGDIGVNGEMSIDMSSTLGGRLIVAGSSGLRLGDDVQLDVGDDLAVGGPLEGSLAGARVTGDASIGGRIDLATLAVSGVLLQPAGSERRVSGMSAIGVTQVGDVSVAGPCACDPAALFDTRAFVAAQAPLAMPLPADFVAGDERCAAYRLADGEASSLHISVHAPTALYAAGDLHVTGDVIIESEAGTAVDLFIAGDVRIDGRIALGAGDGQGPVRVFVGGSGTVQLSSGDALHGTLYAPNAELVLSAPLTVNGALFVRRVAASAALTVHYDRDL